jgi:hypothetical protein
MRWLFRFFSTFFGFRPTKIDRSHLVGMYFQENNRKGRTNLDKRCGQSIDPNRDRA